MIFYLGTHQPHWLSDLRFADVPLFVSRRTLAARKSLPRAVGKWALDSGGFTELQMFGRWTVTPAEYVAEVRRFRDEIGGLQWASMQDWMCEKAIISGLVRRRPGEACSACKRSGRHMGGKPIALYTASLDADEVPTFACHVCEFTRTGKRPAIHVTKWRAWAVGAGPAMAEAVRDADSLGMDAVILFHGTGLSIEEHQRRTVANLLELRSLAPDLPFAPVLQGWSMADYWRCEELYSDAGIDLRAEPTVGVGTVCRRQGTVEATRIMQTLAASGLRLHGFGFKQTGLRACAAAMASADSLAWSYAARRSPPLPGHDKPGDGRTRGHINCANCADYALAWRDRMVDAAKSRRPTQGLFDFGEGGAWA